jgi:serine/threonine-protein kinase ATR
MIASLDEDDVNLLLEITFFIIINYWNVLATSTKEVCRRLLGNLLAENTPLLQERINYLPSFSHIQELSDIEKRLHALRKSLNDRDAFSFFAKRLSHENSGVVLQALVELKSYLWQHQEYLQTSAISEHPDPVITTLVRALLDCSAMHHDLHVEVAQLCVECLGLVGCLDSNQLETTREQRQFVVVHNFDVASETTDFVAFILEEVLVKAFLSATDPSFQGFLSYAMQELLERCDFKAAVAMRNSQSEDIYRKWENMSESVREVLTPFLTSRYRIQPIAQPVLEYPVFRPGRGYAVWLRSFVVDLLHKPQNTFAEIIFEPLSRVIKVKDLAVAEFLLPYLIVHVVVGEQSSQKERENVVNELGGILRHQLPGDASSVERQNMRMYYEVRDALLSKCAV